MCEELYVYYGVGPSEAGTTIHTEFYPGIKTNALLLRGF